jgi:hypothetical protein
MEVVMNVTEYVPLVETTRDELRGRITEARDRFDRLVRSVDPLARPSGSNWTVHQVVAHVLTVAHRYRDYARFGDYHRAADPADLIAINQAELEAAMAPIPVLADQLRALEQEIDGLFDRVQNEPAAIPFHAGGAMDGVTAQTNWLGELLLHGEDVARAVKVPWALAERDMLLVARGVLQIGSAFLRSDVSPDTRLCVVFQSPGARPYVAHIHDGILEMRARRPDDRPDAVLRVPPSTLTQLLYQRIGPFAAVTRGLRIVGGRRPWVSLKMMSYIEPA